jgi:hypothetical protein
MANQVYIPLQSLRLERAIVKSEEKLFLVASMQCWVYDYQYLRVKDYMQTGDFSYEIILANANSAASQTTSLWSGEHKFEIVKYDPRITFEVKTTVYISGKPTGVVTNTISDSGTIPL